MLKYKTNKEVKEFRGEVQYCILMMYTEAFHRIKMAMYGSNSTDKSFYMELRATIRSLKASLHVGICKYHERIEELNDYLPYTTVCGNMVIKMVYKK